MKKPLKSFFPLKVLKRSRYERLKHQRDVATHQRDEVTRRLEEVTHQRDEVAHQRDEVTRRLEEVTHQRDEVAHQRDEVTRRLEEVTHQRDEVTRRLEEVTHQRDEVTHRLEEVTHQRDEALPLRDATSLEYRFTVHHKRNRLDLVSKLCDKYGSDKGEVRTTDHPYHWSSHSYSYYYSRLFSNCRRKVKKVFECGVGTNNPNITSSMGVNGIPGASLRVWRDYFPNASIFGGDIDRTILFEEERIKTYYIDQTDPDSISAFWQVVGLDRFDFIVDDGLHTFAAGSCLFEHSISRLADDGIYVIEDVMISDMLSYRDFFDHKKYIVDYVTLFRPNIPLGDNNLIVVRKM